MSKKFEIYANLDELDKIISLIPKNGIVILQGNLASGKTTLIKEIVKNHNINTGVTSPTFSIMHKYGNIFHYDIYNTKTDGIIKNGLFENLFEDGLHLVEWGDEKLIDILKKYKLSFTVIKISTFQDKRKYEVFCA